MTENINGLSDICGNLKTNLLYMNKIDRSLYEIFADKTLSEGCIINIEKNPIQAKWDGNIRYK